MENSVYVVNFELLWCGFTRKQNNCFLLQNAIYFCFLFVKEYFIYETVLLFNFSYENFFFDKYGLILNLTLSKYIKQTIFSKY